jgi:hypothetical protein
MALLPSGYDPNTLNDVLQGQAKSASANQTDLYQQQRKRTVADQAASGRLMSGVSDYPLTDLDTQNQQAQSGIQNQLATALGGISQEDWLNNQNYLRSYGLANQIGNANRPSTLDQLFQGIGSIGPSVATFAALA